MNYDPNTATTTDKVFVATMLKSVIYDERIKMGTPDSVYDYLKYKIEGVIDGINAEVTLDVIKSMAGTTDE